MNSDKRNHTPTLIFGLVLPLFATLTLDVCSPITMVDAFDLDNSLTQSFVEAAGLSDEKHFHIRTPEKFDVSAGLKTAQKLAGARPLRGFSVSNLRSDGTVDLTTQRERQVSYRFGPLVHPNQLHVNPSLSELGQPTQPVNPGGVDLIHGMQVDVWRPGAKSQIEVDDVETVVATKRYIGFHAHPSSFPIAPTVEYPTCTLAELWERAVDAGVDRERLAVVIYDATGFRFRVPSSLFLSELRFGSDCRPK